MTITTNDLEYSESDSVQGTSTKKKKDRVSERLKTTTKHIKPLRDMHRKGKLIKKR